MIGDPCGMVLTVMATRGARLSKAKSSFAPPPVRTTTAPCAHDESATLVAANSIDTWLIPGPLEVGLNPREA